MLLPSPSTGPGIEGWGEGSGSVCCPWREISSSAAVRFIQVMYFSLHNWQLLNIHVAEYFQNMQGEM